MTKLRLAICSSASSYSKVIDDCDNIEKLGINVILPETASKMRIDKHNGIEPAIDWAESPVGYDRKADAMRKHFDEIAQSDAILVMNYEKHGKANYIGPNVLMEMAVAFFLKKKIYVLYGAPEDSLLIDEIFGLKPVFLNGDIGKIDIERS